MSQAVQHVAEEAEATPSSIATPRSVAVVVARTQTPQASSTVSLVDLVAVPVTAELLELEHPDKDLQVVKTTSMAVMLVVAAVVVVVEP